jgi:capsular polysaccharide export protein
VKLTSLVILETVPKPKPQRIQAESERAVVPENPAFTRLTNARSVLFLQGPCGPLYGKLAHWLCQKGTKVLRVAFNGGDAWDARGLPRDQVFCFDSPMGGWPAAFQRLCLQHAVDVVVLFGQSRPCHAPIFAVAKSLGVDVVVVEEGYFRPGFATFELGGVNGHSKTLDRYEWQPSNPAAQELKADGCKRHFFKTCWHASVHYVQIFMGRKRFPHYVHHRETSVLSNSLYWLRSWKVKLQRRGDDHALVQSMLDIGVRFFFVPLQHDGDAQITQHSRFDRNTAFIEEVLRSFAQHSLPGHVLLFKQHPMSRGGPGHEQFIHALARELDIDLRVYCVWEGHNPSILDACQGVVLINSTVGLQALQRGRPVKVLGQALYDLPGVTAQATLDEFWARPQEPDPELRRHFLQQFKHLTQVPCSIYANAHEVWPFLKTR